jgi:hypothetical protein
LTATAQVAHNVTAANTQLVYKGAREVLGGITFTATAPTTTQGGSIYIVYTVPYTNAALGTATTAIDTVPTPDVRTFTYANGMKLTVRGDGYASSTNWAISSIANINGSTQAQIVISVPNSLAVAPMDQISLDGIRADVSTMAVGASVYASMSSIPSQANTYNPANIIVATVQPNFTVTNVTAGGGVVCANTTTTDASLRITEGFAGAFVQHTGATGYPVNNLDPSVSPFSRPPYGGNANTQFTITVTDLPSGTTLSWPSSVQGSVAGAGDFLLLSVNSATDVATYQFVTGSQALSDQNIEYFEIVVGVEVAGDTAVPGDATVQVQMGPIYSASSSAVPLFKPDIKNDPADLFVSVTRCVTYLLYPYLAHGFGGYDTGIAIANTTVDTGVFTGGLGANPQDGGAALYYFKSFATGGTAADPLVFPVSMIEAGNTWAATMTMMNGEVPGFANSTGYMIAKCQFQNAHGYGYVAYQMGTSMGVAQAYLALVIPDPATYRWMGYGFGPGYAGQISRGQWTTLMGGEALDN